MLIFKGDFMKFIALAVLALSATAAFAQSKRDIYDLQFLPVKGTNAGLTDATYTKNSYRYAEGMSYNQVIGRSFSDVLFASVAVGYADRTGESSYKQTGWSDPSINVKYRLLDDAYRLDIVAGYTQSMGAQEYTNTTFNNKLGGNSMNLGVNFGQKWETMQWTSFINFNRVDSTTTRDNGKSTSAPYNFYTVGGSVLKNYGMINAVATLKGGISDFMGPDTRSTVGYFSIVPEAQYILTSNVLLRASIDFTRYGVKYNNGETYRYNVGATYQF